MNREIVVPPMGENSEIERRSLRKYGVLTLKVLAIFILVFGFAFLFGHFKGR